jgi:hypothetical protein
MLYFLCFSTAILSFVFFVLCYKLPEIAGYFAILYVLIFFSSFLMGMIVSSKACKYTTFGSRINLGYFIGCEVARPRFEPYK